MMPRCQGATSRCLSQNGYGVTWCEFRRAWASPSTKHFLGKLSYIVFAKKILSGPPGTDCADGHLDA